MTQPTVYVNSVRWICPKCFNANPACPSALGQVFNCEKCGTTATVQMSRAVPKLALELRNRGGDYHCQLSGHPDTWDRGSTPEEAIGRWLCTHGQEFGIRIHV